MKKLSTLLFMQVMFLASIFAQAPGAFNYQAALKDNKGNTLADASVEMTFTILKGSANGSDVFSQKINGTTNSSGVINMMIGNDDMADVDWSQGPYFLNIKMSGDAGDVDLGTTQLLSVPYALYAENSGSSTPCLLYTSPSPRD